MIKKIPISLLLITAIFQIQAQEKKQFTVKYINSPIKIDADLSDEPWQSAEPATNFWQYFPSDTVQAKNQTEIKMMFDDKNLYVGIKVNTIGKDYIIPSLRRDFRAGGNDNITLMFDTFNDGTNAFIFGSNPYGVRREILLSGGGTALRGFNGAWDVKWKGEAKIYDGYYICEWEIPLYAFKYNEGETKWRFNAYQFDTQGNERNTWINIPQNQFIFNLAYMGDMVFEKPLGKSRSPISLIPYINTGIYKDFDTNETDNDFKFGGDAKMTIGNSMNLDVTINPDFSQVEVDQLVTNLSRFNVALPERRQFFIENSDLFGDFGNNRESRAFFSRRIGIADVEEVDSLGNSESLTIENNILAGARLSGKLSDNFRLGFLNMQTAEDKRYNIASNNNTVLALQQKLFSRSNVSFLFINRQATKDYDFLNDNDDDLDNNSYNRVVGVDYNLASKDNAWTGKYYIHKSFTPNLKSDDFSVGASTQYNKKNFSVRLSGLYIGENFQSDLGFIRRKGIIKVNPQFQYRIWPKKGIFNRHTFSFTPIAFWKTTENNENSDYLLIPKWEADLKNQSKLQFTAYSFYQKLYDDFNPTGKDDVLSLPEGADYRFTSYELTYESDKRKAFYYKVQPTYGTFYNGTKFTLEGEFSWRLQPYFVASAQYRYDNIQLPKPYPDANLWLLGPRFDVTFSKKLFWTTFVQYSTRQDNFGINSRIQWRFKPLSDLFLVYNDNYYATAFSPRSRSLTVKFSYWLNI